MADFQVLHQEPRYKVEEYVDERLTRREEARAQLATEIIRLSRTVRDQFMDRYQYKVLDHVGFGQPKWRHDGKLVIDTMQVVVVNCHTDDLNAVHTRFCEAWDSTLVGLVDQFAAIKKHDVDFDFRLVRFGQPVWQSDGTIVVAVRYRDRPFAPRDVRWE